MLLTSVTALAPALAPHAGATSWLNAQTLLNDLGSFALWGAALIIFAECGLLLGFFLPGDSLLFTVGLLVGAGTIHQSLWLACLVLTLAALLGNIVGYEVGRAVGPAIFRRPDSRLFKQEHVDRTVAFFDRYGARAVVLARFVPIVRTFITVTAGVGRMDRRRYLIFSTIGAVLWATGVTLLGRALGDFAVVRNNIELMLIAVVAVSVLPIAVEYLRGRSGARREAARREAAGQEAAGQEAAGQEATRREPAAPERPEALGAER